MTDTATLEARDSQRQAAKRATLDLLRSKQRAEQEFTIRVASEAGEQEVSLLFRALGGTKWDELITNNPPTKAQRVEGSSYDPTTFAPALLAHVCVDPGLSEQEWAEIWTGDQWSKGELSELFWGAVGLCNRGLDANPTDRG